MTSRGKCDIIWTDSIRIIAIFSVIVLHAAAIGFNGCFAARSMEWQICNIFDAAARFCVPVFVMVSGVFLLDPAREYDLKKLYFSKILRIAIVYVIWSFGYSLVQISGTLFRNNFSFDSNSLYLFLQLFIQGKTHFWFLFMIAGLYIITPFLRLIAQNKKLTIYFLVLSLFLVFTVNTLSLFPMMKKFFSLSVTRLNIKFIAGYSGYFLWGYWLSRHQLSPGARKVIYILGVLAALATIGLNGFIGYRLNKIGSWMFNNLSLNVLLTASAVFVFCQYNLAGDKGLLAKPQWAEKIRLLGKLSFGIYLIHALVLESLYLISHQYFLAYPGIFIILGSIIVFFISFVVILLLSKIPLINKYAM